MKQILLDAVPAAEVLISRHHLVPQINPLLLSPPLLLHVSKASLEKRLFVDLLKRRRRNFLKQSYFVDLLRLLWLFLLFLLVHLPGLFESVIDSQPLVILLSFLLNADLFFDLHFRSIDGFALQLDIEFFQVGASTPSALAPLQLTHNIVFQSNFQPSYFEVVLSSTELVFLTLEFGEIVFEHEAFRKY